MLNPTFILLYVDSPADSAAFYARLLGAEPIEASPTFAMFALPSGVRLGLWSKHTVEPRPADAAAPGMGELGFPLADRAALERLYDDWRGAGLPIVQEPTAMDFGLTFTARDPDGHRLRAFVPGEM